MHSLAYARDTETRTLLLNGGAIARIGRPLRMVGRRHVLTPLHDGIDSAKLTASGDLTQRIASGGHDRFSEPAGAIVPLRTSPIAREFVIQRGNRAQDQTSLAA